MAETIGTVFDPKRNAIGFLRFFFAAMVVFSHSFPLGGFNTEPLWQFSHGQEHFGTIGVICFFIVSGFLITRSQISAKSTVDYLWHRFLRIMPGFWACLLVTVAVFAPLAYWLERGTLHGVLSLWGAPGQAYLRANWLLEIHLFSIGDLLQKNPLKSAFNGSLWTLVYEFRCYLYVAVLGLLGCTTRRRIVTLVIWLGLYVAYALWGASPESAPKLLLRFADITTLKMTLYFFSGAVLFLYRDYVPINNVLGVASFILTVLSLHYQFVRVAGPLTLGYFVIYAACRLPVTDFDRRGDFSYGLYLYAFPIQQILALGKLNQAGFLPYFLCSLSLSVGLGMISYFAVERPALRLKSLTRSARPVNT